MATRKSSSSGKKKSGGKKGAKTKKVVKHASFCNFVCEAGAGCHIVHHTAPWILGDDLFCLRDVGLENEADVPDISIDPDESVLSVINTSDSHKCYYITIGHPAYDKNNKQLAVGKYRDEKGQIGECTTFILVVQPHHIMDVCYINIDGKLNLHSDVNTLTFHASPDTFSVEHAYPFPLGGAGPYLCTQSFNGELTHFYSTTHHAVDFRAPVGTPVLAIEDGKIIDITQHNTVSGVHVKNLFLWNSVMIQLNDGIFVEYVHIKTGSVIKKVGDTVAKGEVLCESGDIGFCPEPHLHIQMHTSQDKKAETIKFAFVDEKGEKYFPQAGKLYNSNGIQNP